MTDPTGGSEGEAPAAGELRIGDAVERDGLVVVALEGELDMAGTGALDRRLREAERRGLPLVLDLRGLTFIDSTGIAALMACHERLRDAGGALCADVSPGPVLRTLELTGAAEVMQVRPAPSQDD